MPNTEIKEIRGFRQNIMVSTITTKSSDVLHQVVVSQYVNHERYGLEDNRKHWNGKIVRGHAYQRLP